MYKTERKHVRIPLFGVAEVRDRREWDKYLCTALIQNVSEGGAGLYTSQPIESGTPVMISLKFTDGTGTRQSDIVEGTVMATSRHEKFFCVGIAFTAPVTSLSQPYLHRHLTDSLSRRS